MPVEAFDLLSPSLAEQIFGGAEKAAAARGVRDIEVLVAAGTEALTRFANNAIHQNVAEETRHVSVRVLLDRRTARATTNRWDPESIANAVERAIDMARCLEPDPDIPPMFTASTPDPGERSALRYHAGTSNCTPAERARVVGDAIRIVEEAGQAAAGIYSTDSSALAILNSRGVSAFHTETLGRFSITAMAPDSSGWAKASAPDRNAFDPIALARRARDKARASASPRELDPGDYTVILEPAAVLDLAGQMFGDFSGTAVHDQRSFLTGRLGKPLFGTNITIDDDVHHPLQAGGPFDGEGVPRRKLALVEAGVPRELAYCRMAAIKAGVPPTGHGFPVPNEIGEAPMNIVIHGGDSTIERMIQSTARGILVTRLWYIREVDPFEKIMTGMTRDGTFLVENGEVVAGIRNFRFNQSLIEMLSNVEVMTPPERASGEEAFDMVVPGMKVRDFHFTEVTRF